MPRLFTAGVMTTMTCPMLAACLSEEPLPLEVQPLEVVVASRTADEPCLLNVTMVRAGDHEHHAHRPDHRGQKRPHQMCMEQPGSEAGR